MSACCTRAKALQIWFMSRMRRWFTMESQRFRASLIRSDRPREQHLRRWLQDAGFLLWETPRQTSFEGEGRCAF